MGQMCMSLQPTFEDLIHVGLLSNFDMLYYKNNYLTYISENKLLHSAKKEKWFGKESDNISVMLSRNRQRIRLSSLIEMYKSTAYLKGKWVHTEWISNMELRRMR